MPLLKKSIDKIGVLGFTLRLIFFSLLLLILKYGDIGTGLYINVTVTLTPFTVTSTERGFARFFYRRPCV